jgi:hypothetical protein
MYSDGSLLEDKETRKRNVGYTAVGYRLGEEITTRIGPSNIGPVPREPIAIFRMNPDVIQSTPEFGGGFYPL